MWESFDIGVGCAASRAAAQPNALSHLRHRDQLGTRMPAYGGTLYVRFMFALPTGGTRRLNASASERPWRFRLCVAY